MTKKDLIFELKKRCSFWLNNKTISKKHALECLLGILENEESQPSLHSNLDEVAQKVEDYYDVGEEHGYLCCHRGDIKDVFIAGAEWMAGQGETHELTIESPVLGPPMICCPVHANNGDKVIVQIRKTEGSDEQG